MGRLRVAIAGGGVAGLEALLALHELAGERIDATLVAPQEEFVVRPLSVAEPFDLAHGRGFPLREIAREHQARFLHGALARINPKERTAVSTDGSELEYDALLVAVGVVPVEVVPGALTFRGPADAPRFQALLEEVEQGVISSLAFAIPREAAWQLPLYELALLTATRVGELGKAVELHLVSPSPGRSTCSAVEPAPACRACSRRPA